MPTSKTLNEIDETKEKEDLKILEAVFFISGRFLNMQELISLSDLNPIILGDLIERLKDKYNKEESALEIVEKGGLWKMDVKQEYSHIINKLATGSSEFTKAEQETLAIIAFKHPIKQSVIIKIRGNKAYDHIKKFSDLGLIKKKKTGHTHELSLSEDFYDYFNVSESERTNVPGLNEEINKEIEEAEKEVEEEEAEGKSEEEGEEEPNNKAKGGKEMETEEESSVKEESEEAEEEEGGTQEEEKGKEEYTKGILGKGKKPKEVDYMEETDKDANEEPEKEEEVEEVEKAREVEEKEKDEGEYSKGVLGQDKDAIKELREIAEIGEEKKEAKK